MKKIILLILTLIVFINAKSQITTDPEYPFADQSVIVYFDATGTDLQGYSGDIYAHTGVKIEGNSEWQHVIGSWGNNSTQPKLTKISSDYYKLEITPSINDYYSVLVSETVKQMAFVFRSSDGETQSADLLVDVYAAVLDADFSDPSALTVYSLGDDVPVKIVSLLADSIILFVADTLFAKTDSTVLETTVPALVQGQTDLEAKAFNSTDTVYEQAYFFVRKENIVVDLPANMVDGINYINNTTVILVLYAPYKDFVFLKGDFNNWALDLDYQMNKTSDGKRYWLQLDGLNSGQEYAYQYFVDGEFSIADPYTDKILDPWNDSYLSSVYPGLKPYPTGKTEGIVSIFQTAQTEYNWQVTDFKRPKNENLIIYELLIRDFLDNHSYQGLIDTLPYLKNLGINAIELMPFNEFEGNESWGYNPSFYFAPDKYYGTKDKLKEFIDVCHQNGIAVIQDIVYNHSYGQSPLVQLYLDRETWKVTPENPWYNVESPNTAYSWGYDFDHESSDTRRFVDRNLNYWLTEYKIDGFRFDFTKGFTNVSGDGWPYNASRISILKHFADTIWATSPDAYLILEHLSDNSEETVLADYGMLLWGNINNAYCQATMGYNSSSDFSWISYKNRGWSKPGLVGYMESHDEERTMYKAKTWGNSLAAYDITDLNTALKRMELSSVFFFTIPGPKMMWQFMELGYDVSIDDPCRVCNKPIYWNYLENENRSHLYDFIQDLLKLRNSTEISNTDDFSIYNNSLYKQIILRSDTSMVIIGNFDVEIKKVLANFTHSGTWYEYYSGEELTRINDSITLMPGEYRIYTDVKFSAPTFSAAPQAKNISIDGKLNVGSILTADYDYFDIDNDPEGESVFSWYSFNDEFGNGEELLESDNSKTFQLSGNENEKYIAFCVQPVAQSTVLPVGVTVVSDIVGPVIFNSDDIFIYPNPVHGIINFTNISDYNTIIVTDLNGKLVERISVNGDDVVSRDYSGYTEGIYFIKFISDITAKEMKIIKM